MKIKFINHSSIIIDDGIDRIIYDPWITGSAFDNSWDLIIPNDFTINDLNFTKIWYSHEHPDHFSVKDLQELQGHYDIYYQAAPDSKVKKFLTGLGHKVIECPDNAVVRLNEKSEIVVSRVNDDSWILFMSEDKAILNINDCPIEKDGVKELQDIVSKFVDKVDVLLIQYQQAAWAGNPEDKEMHKRQAKLVLERVKMIIKAIKPEYTIPFASMSYFSHEDNFYLNESRTPTEEVITALESTGSKLIMFAPGDVWEVGSPWDNKPAIKRWKEALLHISPQHKSMPSTLDQIEEAFKIYQKRLFEKNDMDSVRILQEEGKLPPTYIKVSDLGIKLQLDILNGLTVSEKEEWDVELSSGIVYYLFAHEWGRGTITVSLFVRVNYSTLWRFLRQTQLAYANNVAKYYPDTINEEQLLYASRFVKTAEEAITLLED